MNGSAQPLVKFLDGAGKRFIIPVYQRNYDWKICVEMNSCRYKTFKQVLGKIQSGEPCSEEHLPQHDNIRGKDFYK